MDPFVIAILLYVAALTLAFTDIFVPSGGMLLVLAAAAAFGAILFGFQSSNTMGMTMLTIVAASVPVFAVVAINIWPRTPIGRRMILHPPQSSSSAKSSDAEKLQQLVGEVFMAESALLPAGQLKIGHRRVNAVVESGIVEAGQTVKVIAVRDRNLIVRLSNEPVSKMAATGKAVEELLPPESNLLDLPADQLGLDSIDE